MEEYITVIWEVDDGYAGGSRPQQTRIHRDDYDACETDKEREKLIDDSVHEDFLQLGYYIKEVRK